MALDFQQVRQQIRTLVEQAPERKEKLQSLLQSADNLLRTNALANQLLQDKVARAAALNPNLRCAVPTDEPLRETFPAPDMPTDGTIIAADGSQINPNRHYALEYCLVNVGAILMSLGSIDAPPTVIQSNLYYDESLFSFTEGMVALMRDQREREILAELAEQTQGPVITFTDGPVELWGREPGLERTVTFQKYLAALSQLRQRGASTAGYVDKPRSDLIVRLLEIAALDDKQLDQAGKDHWLQGIYDIDLYKKQLLPGERTAIFKLQSLSSQHYQEELAIHFFYLNVSSDADYPWLVRVEVPAWVVNDIRMLNDMHAILVQQCQVISNAYYPYMLQRAHETAIVTRAEKEQLDMMISVEMRQRGFEIEGMSQKQIAKDTAH